MLFYDFEVFKHDWLVVVNDVTRRKEYVIINDHIGLEKLHEQNINEIWGGAYPNNQQNIENCKKREQRKIASLQKGR